MNAQNKSPQARSGFRALAALVGILGLFVGCWSVSFAFDTTIPVERLRWITGAASGLFFGVSFVYMACTGRWIRKL